LDDDDSGHVDFGEFMRGIMAPDYQDKHPRVTMQHAQHVDDFSEAAANAPLRSGQNAAWLAWKATSRQPAHGTGGHSHARSSFANAGS